MLRHLKRIIWQNRRFLFIWTLIILLGFVGYLARLCQQNNYFFCDVEQFGPREAVLILGVVFILIFTPKLIGSLFSGLFYRRRPGSFTDDPHLYHKKVVALQGYVVHILENNAAEVVKRKVTDTYRNIVGDSDERGRFIHQRFLMNSPQLRKGQILLVEHNINYGKLPLKKGQLVRVQGEYIHTENNKNDRYYGRIHFTHAPIGGIAIIK